MILGRLIGILRSTKKEYRVYFFFPFYHTGGAEKVHLQIAKATGGSDSIIYFTRHSIDDRFLEEFKATGCVIKDISHYTDNKWLYFLNLIFRGTVTFHINSQTHKPIVFNGQCNFGYKISPWIKKEIPQLELIHSLNTFSYIRIPFLPFITKTVMISEKRIGDHKELYTRLKIPSSYIDRITYIPNAIKIPSPVASKSFDQFIVLYAGRATKEKRVDIIAAIAEILNKQDHHIQFEMAGNVSGSFDTAKYPFIKFHGNINDDLVLDNIYSKAHVLILTSSTEGFPMVVMEAMAHGCVILATPVGDIPWHIKHNENGFLFSEPGNPTTIINEAVEKISELAADNIQYQRMARNNIEYAKRNFGIERFNKDYIELFSSVNQNIETT